MKSQVLQQTTCSNTNYHRFIFQFVSVSPNNGTLTFRIILNQHSGDLMIRHTSSSN